MSNQSKFSSIWESSIDDEPMDSYSHSEEDLEPHVIDDDLDDFLIISDDVNDDVSLGLVDDEIDDGREFSRPTIFRADAPATPPPGDFEDGSQHRHSVREVTPDQKKDIVTMEIGDIRLPGPKELQDEYGLPCKRLGETLWRAEMTRRWRARFSHVDKCEEPDKSRATDFLCGARSTLTTELEVSRCQMWAMIQSPPPTHF